MQPEATQQPDTMRTTHVGAAIIVLMGCLMLLVSIPLPKSVVTHRYTDELAHPSAQILQGAGFTSDNMWVLVAIGWSALAAAATLGLGYPRATGWAIVPGAATVLIGVGNVLPDLEGHHAPIVETWQLGSGTVILVTGGLLIFVTALVALLVSPSPRR